MSDFLFLVAILALAAVAYFWNAKKPNQRQGPRFEAIGAILARAANGAPLT